MLIWVTGHCNRAAVSRNRYGVEKTVDTHKILINLLFINSLLMIQLYIHWEGEGDYDENLK